MKTRQLRWMAKLLSATAVALVVSSAVGPAVCAAGQAVAQAAQAARADDRLSALAAEEKRFWEQRVHLMDVLFPKSRGWTRFDQLPQALLDETPDSQRSVLIAMGLNLNGAGEVGGWRRDAKDFVGGLRRLGRKGGLIYSGQAPDREGELSAVWPTYPSGKPQALPVMQIVRVGLGAEPRFTGRDHGCCADTLEAFYRADLNDPDGAETVRSSTLLKVPEGAVDGRFPLSLNAGCTVRFSPEIYDTPRPDNDSPMPDVGNVARKFTAISDAVGLMAWFDRDGKAWVLIKTNAMDDAMATYSDHGGPPVDVGWIEASQINKQDNPAFWAWLEDVRSSAKSTSR